MHAFPVGFLDLLNDSVQFRIPRWQRRYCWEAPDVTRLVEDLVSIAGAAKAERSHYGGSLITYTPMGTPAGVVTIHRVVDGQQRLTTVSLLLACIADHMDADDRYGAWSQEDIRDLLGNPDEKTPDKRRKLSLQNGDEDEYVRILQGKPKGDGPVTNAWRVVGALVQRHGPERVMAGLDRFRVVSLGVGANDDPQQIFESLNATGRALTESEKVKNWLLMGLRDAEQQELYEKYWLKIEQELGAQHTSKPVDLFLRDLMRMFTGKITAMEHAYEVFRRWAIENGWDDRERRRDLFARLAHLAGLYGMLTGTAAYVDCSPARRVLREDEGIAHSLRHLRAMGIDTHRPFTLRLLCELVPAAGDPISTLGQTRQLFEVVGTWITRLWLTDRTAGLNTAFARLAALDSVRPDSYLGDWMKRIHALHRQDVGVPTDEELVHGIRTKRMFFGKRARLAVLCALMESEDGPDPPSRRGLWTERVMPMRLTDDWRERLGPDGEEVHAAWRYRLANLALVGAVRDAPGEYRSFEDKKKWYQTSPIGLTRRLAAEPSWDQATLLRRSDELAKRAIRVWPWHSGHTETE